MKILVNVPYWRPQAFLWLFLLHAISWDFHCFHTSFLNITV